MLSWTPTESKPQWGHLVTVKMTDISVGSYPVCLCSINNLGVWIFTTRSSHFLTKTEENYAHFTVHDSINWSFEAMLWVLGGLPVFRSYCLLQLEPNHPFLWCIFFHRHSLFSILSHLTKQRIVLLSVCLSQLPIKRSFKHPETTESMPSNYLQPCHRILVLPLIELQSQTTGFTWVPGM